MRAYQKGVRGLSATRNGLADDGEGVGSGGLARLRRGCIQQQGEESGAGWLRCNCAAASQRGMGGFGGQARASRRLGHTVSTRTLPQHRGKLLRAVWNAA